MEILSKSQWAIVQLYKLIMLENSKFILDLSNHSFQLNKLLHVPSITKNLLSVSQFAKDNKVCFEFHHDSCCVKCQDTKEIFLQGIVDNGLYKFPSFKPIITQAPTPFLSSVMGDANFHFWHSRLSYPSPTVVSRVLKSCNLPFAINKSVCTSCCLGKFHQFELVYSNIWGLALFPSMNGARYYIHFIYLAQSRS